MPAHLAVVNAGGWGCAWAKDTDLGRKHWDAIGQVLVLYFLTFVLHVNGNEIVSPPAHGKFARKIPGLKI